MSPTETERRIREANAVAPNAELPEGAADAERLLTLIDQRVADLEMPQPSPLVPAKRRPRIFRRGWVITATVAIAVLIPVVAATIVVRSGPSEPDAAVEPVTDPASTAALAYADFPDGQILRGDEWAVITFLRPPSCIPPTIDLISPPSGIAPSDCGPVTVTVVRDGDTLEYLGGGEVPVWFVPAPVLDAVSADGDLTRRELLSLNARYEGVASDYRRWSDGVEVQVTASGLLDEGGSFSFDGTVSRLAVSMPDLVRPATQEDLIGTWENGLSRVQFREDGSMTIQWLRIYYQEPGDKFSEATFVLDDGIVTWTEDRLLACHLADAVSQSDYVGSYYGLIDPAGRLILERIFDNCDDRAAIYGEPFTRTG